MQIKTYETTIALRAKTNKYLKDEQYKYTKAIVKEIRCLGILLYKEIKQLYHN